MIVGKVIRTQKNAIIGQIRGGENFGDRPAKDIIIKDIIKNKIEWIKELEAKVGKLEDEVQTEWEEINSWWKMK